jgi:type II secretory pathway pseudopilin PulG
VHSRKGDEALSLGQRLARLRRQIAAAEAALVEREAELAELRVEVASFQLRYETLVGRQLAALREVEASIAACQKQIQGFRRWGRSGPPAGWDGEAYVPVDEQYRRTWHDPAPPGPSFTPPTELATQSAAKQDLKTLYRQLCRRFHPDLTQDPAERAWRTEMMAAVNAAYAAQSRAELQALATTPYRGTSSGAAQKAGQETIDTGRLDALQDRLTYLRRKLLQVEAEIDELTHSPLMEMRLEVTLAARQGQDLLGDMAREVARDLAKKQAELDYLRAQLRALGMEDGP